jgi:hypothetical protein
MLIQEKLVEILRSRKQTGEYPRDQMAVEFIVSLSPSGTLRWKLVDAKTGQPRPPIFGRSEAPPAARSQNAQRPRQSQRGRARASVSGLGIRR